MPIFDPFVQPSGGGDFLNIPWWMQDWWGDPVEYFASRPPMYQAPEPPGGGLGELLDPLTMMPQSVVDRIWSIDPPKGVPDELLRPHEIFGLPKWMVERAQRFLAEQGHDPDFLPLFFQTWPWATILAVLSPSWTPNFKVDVEEPAPKEPQAPQEPQAPKEPQVTAPTPEEPELVWTPEGVVPVFVVDVVGKMPKEEEPPKEPEKKEPEKKEPPKEPPKPPTPPDQLPIRTPPVFPPVIGKPGGEDQQGEEDSNKPGGGFALPSLGSMLSPVGSPLPGQPAMNVGMLRNIISQFLTQGYMPGPVPGLRPPNRRF